MKIMAIDMGERRVGMASTDDSGNFALPREVYPNDGELVAKILEFKLKNAIDRVVIGESRNLDGRENEIMKEVYKLRDALVAQGVEVVLHPEIFTTQEAIRLQGENRMVDASAAALILKNYIESIG